MLERQLAEARLLANDSLALLTPENPRWAGCQCVGVCSGHGWTSCMAMCCLGSGIAVHGLPLVLPVTDAGCSDFQIALLCTDCNLAQPAGYQLPIVSLCRICNATR